MKIEKTIIETRKIGQINEALFILKHFIQLSAKLLPFLKDLTNREELTENEISDKHKIIKVYLNYSFDTKTSEHLLDSDILKNIQLSFRAILTKSEDTNSVLHKFLSEFERLQKKWTLVDCN